MLKKADQPQVIDRKVWLTVSEAAMLSRYSKEHIRRLARGDTLTSLKIGSLLLIERQSLIDYAKGYTASPKLTQLSLNPPKIAESDNRVGLTFEQWLGMSEKRRGVHRLTLQQSLRELRQDTKAHVLREGVDEKPYNILVALEANGRTHFASQPFIDRK